MKQRQQLGQQLLSGGHITAEQLDAALAMQRQFGGRLGTNLIEIGALRVDPLAEQLGRQLGVPAAVKDHFVRADRELFRQFPKKLAAKHNVAPLWMAPGHGKVMAVAMRDPLDLAALDELSLVLGCRLEPLVAPEARLQFVLEKVWGIKPNRRTFIRMDLDPQQLQQAFARMQRQEANAASPSSAIASPRRAAPPAPVPAPRDPLGPRPRRPAAPPALTQPMAATAPRPLPPATPQRPERPARPMLSAPAPPPTPAPGAPARKDSSPPTRPAAATLLPATLAAIGAASERDRAAEAALDYLAEVYGCGLLLLIKNDLVLGWRGRIPGVEATTLEALLLPLGAPSVFATVVETGQPFRGPPPPSGEVLHERLWKLLRRPVPEDLLVVPVVLGTRVVQLVLVQDPAGLALPARAGLDVAELAKALAETYGRLIRRQRG